MDQKLQKLGLDNHYLSIFTELGVNLSLLARVISEHKGLYNVKTLAGEYTARITGKQRHEATGREDYPVVGDWVEISLVDQSQAMIIQILPRKSIIQNTTAARKSIDKIKTKIIATNVDVAFITESVDRDYSINRFERYFALLEAQNITPIVILNKADLISPDDLNERIVDIKKRFSDCAVIATSTKTEAGLDNLKDIIESGKTHCFLGSSGVGKSSLINSLIGEDVARTGKISEVNERGKHVTTHREMYFLENGAIVIDNPGMRQVGSINSSEGIKSTFNEIEDLALQCKFSDCTHTHEAGCAVKEAAQLGEVNKERYDNYLDLKKEADFYSLKDYEKRDKDRAFSKHIKNSIKRLKDFE